MDQCFRSFVALVVILFVAGASQAQTPSDDSADTSAAQAAIQGIQSSATPPAQAAQQAYPALKAQSCKEAVSYVEDKDHGLLRRWDDDMQKLKTDRIGALAKINERTLLLHDTYWDTSPIVDVENEVRLLCRMTRDVLALLTPGGNALNTGIQISEDFGARVSERAIKVYQLLEKGDNVNEVLHSSTDELVVWAIKDQAAKAGAGRLVAAFDLVQAIQERDKTAQELADSRLFVQQKVKELDTLINEIKTDLQAQRDDLLAVEALKDAVQAACNSGTPIQVAPEFASGAADAYLPVQNASGPVAPPTPWWANLGTINIPLRGATARPPTTASKPAPSSTSSGRSSTDVVSGKP